MSKRYNLTQPNPTQPKMGWNSANKNHHQSSKVIIIKNHYHQKSSSSKIIISKIIIRRITNCVPMGPLGPWGPNVGAPYMGPQMV